MQGGNDRMERVPAVHLPACESVAARPELLPEGGKRRLERPACVNFSRNSGIVFRFSVVSLLGLCIKVGTSTLNVITGSKGGRPSSPRTIPVTERRDENRAKRLELDMTLQGLPWIVRPGQTLEMFREIEKPGSRIAGFSRIVPEPVSHFPVGSDR